MKPLRATVLVVLLGALAACTTPAAAPPPPHPVVTPRGEIFLLDVAEVEVVQPPPAAMNEPVDMVGIVADWCRQRLRPVGASGKAKVTIHNALIRESFVRTPIPGALTFQRLRKFDGRLDVHMDVTNRSTQRFGFADGSAARSRTAPQDIDEGERQRIWYDMAQDMLDDLNVALESSVRQRLRWLLR